MSMYPAASILKDSKMVRHREKPSDAGQGHLPRSKSWRLKTCRRSSSISSMCILPSIPEYPGFQDLKQKNYPRCSDANSGLQDTRRTAAFFFKGQCKNNSSFCDKTLQDYFNERLMELRNYDAKKSNGKLKDFLDENQKPSVTSRGLRRRSSCSAVMQAKVAEGSSGSVDQVDESETTYGKDHSSTQNVQGSCKRNYLESLTMSINGPLQMFVQRN